MSLERKVLELPEKVKKKIPGWLEQLELIHDFWRDNEKEKAFSPGYITTNKKLKQKYANIGFNLYSKTIDNLGSFDELIKKASKRIQKDYSKRDYSKGFTIEKALKDLRTTYNFWKENEKEEAFSPIYIIANKKLKRKYRNLGQNLYENTRNNLRSFDELIKKASKRIQKDYKKQRERFTKEKALKDLRTIHDFWKKNEKEKAFSPTYITTNKELKQKHANIGVNLYVKTINNLGSFDALIKEAPKRIQKDYVKLRKV